MSEIYTCIRCRAEFLTALSHKDCFCEWCGDVLCEDCACMHEYSECFIMAMEAANPWHVDPRSSDRVIYPLAIKPPAPEVYEDSDTN